MNRLARLRSLGRHRVEVIECLGGTSQFLPAYFDPPADINIFDAYRVYVARMSVDPDPLAIPLLAAARLLTGDLAAADAIVDLLPAKPYQLDHGAGMCLVKPQHALRATVPMPSELGNTDRWLAGSGEQATLRAWLAGHRNKLRWLESPGFYLPSAAGQSAQPEEPSASNVTRVRHLVSSGLEFRHCNSDLMLVDGMPTIFAEWDAERRHPIPLDPAHLHRIDWEDAQYVYERPVAYPDRPFRRSFWQRIFG